MADDRPQYQYGLGTIGGTQFHWGSGTPGQYWSIPYGDYPVTPNAPTGAWAHQAGAIPIANNVIPDPQLGRNRIGIMIHSGSAPSLDQLYTQGCFKVAPQEWPAVRSEILKEAANGPLYLHVAPGGVAAFTNTKTFSQAGDQTPAANANAAANTTAAPSPQGTTLNTSNVIDTLSRNIAGIESGGWKNPYEALNPTTQAVGKYQVMPNNVPGWTLAATGKSMTPDEFRADPNAQEAVFRDQMQRSLQLYSPKDAASIWFTGKPFNVAGPNVADANKTTNANYVARATAGLPDSGTFTPNAAVASSAASPTTTPNTPGTTINSLPAVAPSSSNIIPGFGTQKASDTFKSGLQQMTGGADQAPDERPPQMGPPPMARNVSPLLGMSSQIAQMLQQNGAQAPAFGSAPPGKNPYAGAGLQSQPIQVPYGISLNSLMYDPSTMMGYGNPSMMGYGYG